MESAPFAPPWQRGGGGALIANFLPNKNSQNLTKVEMGAYGDNLGRDVEYYNVEQPFDPWMNPTIDYENLPVIDSHPSYQSTYAELTETFDGTWGLEDGISETKIHKVYYNKGVICFTGNPAAESAQAQTEYFAELWALLSFCHNGGYDINTIRLNLCLVDTSLRIPSDSTIGVDGYKLTPLDFVDNIVFPAGLTIALCYGTTFEEIFPSAVGTSNGAEIRYVQPSFFAVNDRLDFKVYNTFFDSSPTFVSYAEQLKAGATELEVSSIDDLIGVSEILGSNDATGATLPQNLVIKQTADIYVGNNVFVNIVNNNGETEFDSGLNLSLCNATYDGQGHGLYGLKLGALGLKVDFMGTQQDVSVYTLFMGGTVKNLTLAGGALPGCYNLTEHPFAAFVVTNVENCVMNFDLSAVSPNVVYSYFSMTMSISNSILYGYSPMYGILDSERRNAYMMFGLSSHYVKNFISLQAYGAYSPVCEYANKNISFMLILSQTFGEHGTIQYKHSNNEISFSIAETFYYWRVSRSEGGLDGVVDNFPYFDAQLFINKETTTRGMNVYIAPQFGFHFASQEMIQEHGELDESTVKGKDWYSEKGLNFDFDKVWGLDPNIWNGFPYLKQPTSGPITWTSDGNYAEEFGGGDGSEATPYEIANAPQLARLAYLVNNNVDDYRTKYYKQTGNIDLSAFPWSPIEGFAGHFTGSCYKIIGMDVNVTENAALFGNASGIIENVYLEGIVSGTNNVAGIIASGTATLSHSYFDGVFNLPDGATNVGTLVGSGTGAVTNCGARVVVNTTSQIEVSTAGTCSSVYSEAVINSGSGTTMIRKLYGTDFSNSVWFWDVGINEGYPIFKDWFWTSAFVPDVSIYDKLKELGFVDA